MRPHFLLLLHKAIGLSLVFLPHLPCHGNMVFEICFEGQFEIAEEYHFFEDLQLLGLQEYLSFFHLNCFMLSEQRFSASFNHLCILKLLFTVYYVIRRKWKI